MALRLYLSPIEQVGGYANIPTTTQVFNSTLGPPSNNGQYINSGGGVWCYFCMPGSDRTLPVFELTTTQPPATAATVISWDIPQTLTPNPAGGTTYYQLATPVAIGVTRITEALIVNPNNWIPDVYGGGVGQWAAQFRDENWLNSVTYESMLGLIPAIAYIWRPSTNSLVGTLWDVYSQNNALILGCWGANSYSWYSTWGDWSPYYIYYGSSYNFSRGTDSPVLPTSMAAVAVQADDVIVIEYWQSSYRANTGNGSGMRGSMSIGGGTDIMLNSSPLAISPPSETVPTYNTFVSLPTLTEITFPTAEPFLEDREVLAQTAEFPPPKPTPSSRYDLNIYGHSLDKVTGVQFMPYGPQYSLNQNVIIEEINGELNAAGTLPFIIPYRAGEGVYINFDVYGQNFDYVTGMQFVPYGPISQDPSPTPTGPPEPAIPLVEGDYFYDNPTYIGIGSWQLLNYLDNGTFQRSTWYKLLLTCDESQIPIDPTLVPSGPPVPTIPLITPDFALVTNQHIGIPYSIQQWLLNAGITQRETWYKFYLTYECGVVPPTPTARAIQPSSGWNWDPAYVIMPDVKLSQYIEEFKTSLFLASWSVVGDVTTSVDGLVLQAGPQSNGWASATENINYPCGDWTIDFHIKRRISSDTTDSVFTYVGLDYWMYDIGWEVWIERTYQPDVGHAYVAYINDGVDEYSGVVATNAWDGSLRIIRHKQSITLLAKDWGDSQWQTVVYTRAAPDSGIGVISMYTSNNEVPQKIGVVVERFTQNPGVMFGLEPAVYTEIGPSNINLLVQPQIEDTTRFVTIATYIPLNTIKETPHGFEYIRPNRFSLGGSPDVRWWMYRDVPTSPGIEQAYTLPKADTQLLNITLTPKYGQYVVNQVIQYNVMAKYNDGSTRDVSSQCTWTTSDADGTLYQNGLMYFGDTPSLYYVTATYLGMTQTAMAYVTKTIKFAQSAELT
jgi:hypothetical protein